MALAVNTLRCLRLSFLANTVANHHKDSLVQYLKFLQVLIALGPKLPAILAALQSLFDAISAAIPAPTEGTLEVSHPSTSEMEAEQTVAAMVAAPNAAFDGSRLRGLYKFLNDSGLLAVLISVLAKGAVGS
jgi:hypothetical protein